VLGHDEHSLDQPIDAPYIFEMSLHLSGGFEIGSKDTIIHSTTRSHLQLLSYTSDTNDSITTRYLYQGALGVGVLNTARL
jgi:hypothetical protein